MTTPTDPWANLTDNEKHTIMQALARAARMATMGLSHTDAATVFHKIRDEENANYANDES